MNEVIATVIRWTLRLVVFAMGLVLFLSLLAAALLLASLWIVRALWARVTGRPVTPWVMRMDPRSGWSTVRRSTARWTAPRPAAGSGRERADVTDVVARELP